MNVSFVSDSPKNSAIIDGATGNLLFETSTPAHKAHYTTTLSDAQGRTIGVYNREWLNNDSVTYRYQTTSVSEYLTKENILSGDRIFKAPDGKTYRWKWPRFKGDFELVDCETGQLVALGHRKHRQLFSPSEKPSIDVLPDGMSILDTIVLTFVICELIKRRKERQAVGGGGFSG